MISEILPRKIFITALVGACLRYGCGGPAVPKSAAAESPQPVTRSAAEPAVMAIGKGSYASFPPPGAGGDGVQKFLNRELYLVDASDRPIPTNHWWTNLMVDRYTGQLWAFPLMVKADETGTQVFFPTRWNDRGTDPVSENPLTVGGHDFKPADARARNWSDWLVTFREGESAAKYMDVTVGRGLPYVWFEAHGVAPEIKLSGAATFFDKGGAALQLPAATDHVGVECGGRSYGVFAPDGTRFTQEDDRLSVQFAGDKTYLVLCPLPGHKDLSTFYQFAFAIPRDSKLSWDYDPGAAKVTTQWHLTTELLKGAEHRLIQGWLPHHYRDTTNDLTFNDLQYLTPRGTMKCAAGTDFTIGYAFNGFPASLPAPAQLGLPHDFDEARMRDYIDRYATRTEYGADTYWGGKSLTQFAQYMMLAEAMHDTAARDKLRDSLRTALADWFTYTPGEQAHFFARYPKWRALVGFNPSYGSEGFNDHHFHYGYFTTAAAMLGLTDPKFLEDYGGMARLVAKEYANWDRKDTGFPFLRTFDIWEGHSWAAGTSSPTGNNQESSSEAVQSWGGLFLLGVALDDKAMTAAGAMGYAMETRAVMEYWFNVHGDNFAPNFGHPITGMVWSGGNLWGTYFTGDPSWIFGINWLPMSPMMSYLVQDPVYAKKELADMWTEYKNKEHKGTISSMGPALGNVILGQAQQVDPDWAVEQMDQLWDAHDKVAHDNDTPGIMYYFAHANRMLGQIQWNYHMSLPLSRVYYNERTKTSHYIAFNPSAAPQTAEVFKDGKKIGQLLVPPRQLMSVTKLASYR